MEQYYALAALAAAFFFAYRSNSLAGRLKMSESRAFRLSVALRRARRLRASSKFTSELEFLTYMLSFKVSQEKKYVFEPSIANTRSGLVSNKIFDKSLQDVTSDILSTMSPAYRSRLSRFVAADRIDSFVTEHVMAALTSAIGQTNSRRQRARPPMAKLVQADPDLEAR